MNNTLLKSLSLLGIVSTLLISCGEEEQKTEPDLQSRISDVEWRNSQLHQITIDSNRITILRRDMFPEPWAFEYYFKSDTMVIKNKMVEGFKLMDYKDSVSYLLFENVSQSGFKLKLVNADAQLIFKEFSELTFYNSETLDRSTYYVEQDSACNSQVENARKDLALGKVIHFQEMHYKFKHKDELIQALSEHNITFKNAGPPNKFPIRRNCYRETMDDYISKEFGTDFIENLLIKIQSKEEVL